MALSNMLRQSKSVYMSSAVTYHIDTVLDQLEHLMGNVSPDASRMGTDKLFAEVFVHMAWLMRSVDSYGNVYFG